MPSGYINKRSPVTTEQFYDLKLPTFKKHCQSVSMQFPYTLY